MSSSQSSQGFAGRRFGAALGILVFVVAALALVLSSGGSAQARGSGLTTTLNSKGGDSAADSSGAIYIDAGDSVEFKPGSVFYTIMINTSSFPGGSSSARLPYSGKSFTFNSAGDYGFSWTVTLSSSHFYGTIVVTAPGTPTPTPTPTPTITPTSPATSSTPTQPGTSTTPTTPANSGTATGPATGPGTGSGSAGTSGSSTPGTGTSGSSTPAPGSGGISFPVTPITSIPVNGFAGPGTDPGTGVPGANDPLPSGKGTIADGSAPPLNLTSPASSTSGDPSAASLSSPSSGAPTGLAVIAILAFAIVASTYAYRRLGKRA